MLTSEMITNLCKIGKGNATCSFLMVGSDGLECAKGTSFETTLRIRREASSMVALGDNCSGPPYYRVKEVE